MDAIIKSLAFDPKIFLFETGLFLLLWFLMNMLFWKPYLTHLQARSQGIVDAHETHDRLHRDMETLRADYLARLAQIEGEARTHIQTAIKDAQAERERVLKEAREQSDTAIATGLATMERERRESLVALQGAMIGLSVEAASKALGSAADPVALRTTVEQKMASRN